MIRTTAPTATPAAPERYLRGPSGRSPGSFSRTGRVPACSLPACRNARWATAGGGTCARAAGSWAGGRVQCRSPTLARVPSPAVTAPRASGRAPSRGAPQRVGRNAGRPPPRGSSPRPLRRRRRATSRAPSRSATRRNSGPRPSQNSSGASRSQSSPVRRARPWFSTVGRVSFPSLSSSGARAVRLQLCLSAVLIPCALASQTPAAVQRAANSITPEGVRHHIGVLADDSMLGRATPSPQLEQTARYVAEQFRRFGLKPAGDTGYLQRYTVTQRVVDTQASVIRIAGAAPATLQPGSDV